MFRALSRYDLLGNGPSLQCHLRWQIHRKTHVGSHQLAVCESGNRYMRQVYEQLLLSANDSLLQQSFLCEPEHVCGRVQSSDPACVSNCAMSSPGGQSLSDEFFRLAEIVTALAPVNERQRWAFSIPLVCVTQDRRAAIIQRT